MSKKLGVRRESDRSVENRIESTYDSSARSVVVDLRFFGRSVENRIESTSHLVSNRNRLGSSSSSSSSDGCLDVRRRADSRSSRARAKNSSA